MKRLMAFSVLTAAMALPALGGDSAGLLQKFLDTSKAYNALPAVKRTPAFRLEPVGKRKQWYYLCDGDRHVGLIGEDVQLFDKNSKSYRLSAWVKTKGLKDGGAYLEVSGWRGTSPGRFASVTEPKLAGDHDWTRLQIEFGPMAGGMSIKLCAEGTGTAWFDDVELMEVAR